MNLPQTEPQTLEPVNPLDILKPEWEVNRKSVRVDSLIVRHDIQTPDEAVLPPMTHHMIALQLSHGSQQVTHIGDKQYEGVFSPGEFFLQPTKRSAF